MSTNFISFIKFATLFLCFFPILIFYLNKTERKSFSVVSSFTRFLLYSSAPLVVQCSIEHLSSRLWTACQESIFILIVFLASSPIVRGKRLGIVKLPTGVSANEKLARYAKTPKPSIIAIIIRAVANRWCFRGRWPGAVNGRWRKDARQRGEMNAHGNRS